MKPADLKIGALYQLTQDVENPFTDFRSANEMLKTGTFKEGTTFVCMAEQDAPGLRRLYFTRHTITGHTGDNGFTAAIVRNGKVRMSNREDSQQWSAALLPHLEELPIDSWERLRLAYGWEGMDTVLRVLVEEGDVPLERVIELMKEHTLGASALP
jgi:hypothetical protein